MFSYLGIKEYSTAITQLARTGLVQSGAHCRWRMPRDSAHRNLGPVQYFSWPFRGMAVWLCGRVAVV